MVSSIPIINNSIWYWSFLKCFKVFLTLKIPFNFIFCSHIVKCVKVFLTYIIFIDASGWVINDVSFGFTGERSCNIWSPRPNDPVGIDLTPTPIPAAKLRSFHTRQMTAELALSLGIIFNFATANQSSALQVTSKSFF